MVDIVRAEGRADAVAKEYVQRLEDLLRPAVAMLPAGFRLEIKHFFSGAAAYADGRIYLSLTTVGLAIKLPDDARETLLADGATPLRYFPKAPIKKQYVVLPPHIVADELAVWVRKSIDYVLTLPPPKPSKRRKRA